MPTEEKTNKMITIFLVLIISIAAITVLYVNLPQDNQDDDSEDNEGTTPSIDEPILTTTYDDTIKEYDLSSLEDMSSISDSGSYVKTRLLPDEVIIKGPWEFTGVKMETLINDFSNLPPNYNITVTASDGWTSEFTKDQVQGKVNIYNESGAIVSTQGATMILAYKEDGDYITDEEVGPLRIAFVGNNPITESNLWSKMVESIEIEEI